MPWEELDVQDQIGGGGFSIVHRGFWRGTPVAVKKWFDPSMSEEMMQDFRCVWLCMAGYDCTCQLVWACIRRCANKWIWV
jgi:predicted Ser/Thr protein kinase